MTVRNSITNNKGFSLIELMVVVAIIGILAAVAIPNVSKYMNKAKQSEAKVNLSSIYMAEKAYYAEQNQYSNSFATSGYAPEGQFKYDIGFTTGDNTGNDCGSYKCSYTGNLLLSTMTATYVVDNATSPATFTAGASQKLGRNDVWKIDQNKALVQTSTGE